MSDIIISKPLPFLLKEIGFDFKSTLITISKVIGAGMMGDVKGAYEHIIDMLGSFHQSNSPEEEMWKLIATSLRTSLVATSLDYKELFADLDSGNQLDGFDLEHEIKKIECTFDASFFSHPEKNQFLKEMKNPVKIWLDFNGFHDYQTLAFLNKLESHFVFSLHREWAENSEAYSNLSSFLVTPFTTATLKQRKWASYQQGLTMMSKDRVFNEVFSLEDVYVPLRGYYLEKNDSNKKRVVDINSHLIEWLNECNLKDPIKLISGGPGCGKSSLTKILTVDISRNRYWNVLHVPLHHFDLQDDLLASIAKYTLQNPNIGFDAIDVNSGFDRLVLIFDGLDELSMQGKAASETALRFVDELARILYRVNSQNRSWQAIVTGRDISIQSSEVILKNEGQILHVLPYFVNNHERYIYIDPDQLLLTDQRDVWWKKFGLATGRQYKSFPSELNNNNLEPITKEPLLNYLVSFSFVRGNLNISKNVSLNKIYEELLSQVHSRNYENRCHINTNHLSREEFIEILEEIAITVWKGKNGRTATEHEIYTGCVNNGLATHLQRFSEGAEKGVVRLLTAFYFRQFGSNSIGDRTFEFTHKSFGEYLAARRILEEVKYLSAQLEFRKKSRKQGIDLDMALIKWLEMFGSTRIDKYVGVFFETELKNYSVKEVLLWQVSLSTLLNVVMVDGLPVEKADFGIFSKMLNAYKYSLESLFFIYNSCASYTKKIEELKLPNAIALGECINVIRDYGSTPSLIANSLGGLLLSEQNLSRFDLNDFRFELGHFLNVNLFESNMRGASFSNHILDRCDCSYTKFNNTVLYKSKFTRTVFEKSSGCNCRAEYSDFFKCKFGVAKMERSKFDDCNFTSTRFPDASFRFSDFFKVTFKDCQFLNVNFSDCIFIKTIFDGMNLSIVDFSNARLKNVTFIDIKKSKFNFEGATLDNVKFIRVNINPEELRSQAKKCSGVEIQLREEIEDSIYDEDTGIITW
ncbi:hypothetical protein F0249_17050 [Vibrio sp. 03-59-1]|uniref:pentapeptide repeat-containing protein n=1 Tax=Vibrio sp. 03-59-1 TaxID=2607607 RepID=UPI001493A7C9|nr:pentapeptide repeat-containing protein [Vibrio sp. 03-59-1]NOH85505.1 hypothetical protein [Vibrio sp. 03-59-1]